MGVIISGLSVALAPGSGFAQGTSVKTEKKPNWYDHFRMSYMAIYDGPRFTNFDLTKTQGANDPASDYTLVINVLKMGYAVSKRVTMGFEFSGNAPFNPAKQFSFGDIKNYVSWNQMVNTDDLEIQGVLKVAYPTSEGSIKNGKLLTVRAQGNWNFKTSLRNWNFSASTKLTSHFYRDPGVNSASTSDFDVALEPAISVDVLPNVQWLFEAAFDANHNFNDSTFDFRQADGDTFDTGPSFNLGSHINLSTVIKFYTERPAFDNAALSALLIVTL
ncbi:MAG: hypothetical protein EBX52_05090 [Proteobacteria bacterium]|nr:hypothetical protein [Pseudomonadota bacterium]